MRSLFAIIFALLCSICYAQTEGPVIWTWDDVRDTQRPDTILAISFERYKLDSLPDGLRAFTNLEMLDLSKNKLVDLPQYIQTFTELREINLDKNKLMELPTVLCGHQKLESLILSRNEISRVSACIGRITNLKYIDLYDNPIRVLPDELESLNFLEEIDLSGIRFSPAFQQSWHNRLPKVNWIFDEPCDCMD